MDKDTAGRPGRPARRTASLPLKAVGGILLAALLACLALPSGLASAATGGDLLPSHRIVAYYGNPLTPAMGVLGMEPTARMLQDLARAASAFAALDPSRPVARALEMVTTVATATPGPDHLYRLDMPAADIQRELTLARRAGDLLILDLQVGRASVRREVRRLTPFLLQPDVELALDPEFDMPPGAVPGRSFGRLQVADVNWTLSYLSQLVRRHHLPQKVLIVHQFVGSMLPGWADIRPVPGVAFVKDMDGFGSAARKIATYEMFVAGEPDPCLPLPTVDPPPPDGWTAPWWRHALGAVRPLVCGGIKLFYHQDVPLLTPAEVLKLSPPPLVVIYQ